MHKLWLVGKRTENRAWLLQVKVYNLTLNCQVVMPQEVFQCINMCPESDHKRFISTGVNAPMPHWGCIRIEAFRPHLVVVRSLHSHILSAVWTHSSSLPQFHVTLLQIITKQKGASYPEPAPEGKTGVMSDAPPVKGRSVVCLSAGRDF